MKHERSIYLKAAIISIITVTIGSLFVILFTTVFVPANKFVKELTPLPDEQRYSLIDKVLSDIDYQNIGKVTSEVKDEGDGVFVASYKRISYDDPEVFDKIAKKLANPEDKNTNYTCEYSKEIENIDQYNCTYYGTVISMGKGPGGTSIEVSDSSSGRK